MFASLEHRHVARRALGKVGSCVGVPESEVERWVVVGEPGEGEWVEYEVSLAAWGEERWQ
jgi:hypothetical protein